MQALIIGATGATGSALVQQLLDNQNFTSVRVFVRKPLNIQHEKLRVEIIDFDDIKSWQDKVQGDVLFSCLGTTLKAAGSKEAQWKIDHDYQLHFAQIARQNGVPHLVLISAMYASTKSMSFYTRMKGQLEQAIEALAFPYLSILRPPLLIRPNSDRAGEKILANVFQALNRVGMLKNQRPLPVAHLAQVMQKIAQEKRGGIFESREIWRMVQ